MMALQISIADVVRAKVRLWSAMGIKFWSWVEIRMREGVRVVEIMDQLSCATRKRSHSEAWKRFSVNDLVCGMAIVVQASLSMILLWLQEKFD
jgi:uncharacterized membrane protein